MIKLNEYKEEIYKCSGCGQCQNVCPVFQVMKTECAVSRGKFKLLNAIINNDMNFSKKTLKYMELCLHCQACTKFCPSGIDAEKIIETAQFDMMSCKIFNLPKFILTRIFTNDFVLKITKILINFVRITKVLEILSLFNIKKIKLLNSFLKIKLQSQKNKQNTEKSITVLFFKGCINNYINPSSANAVFKILADTNVKIIEAKFSCCGLPLKSQGDFKGFKKIIQKNLDAIKNNFDYIIFDCASCKNTFLSYPDFLEGTYKAKALEINSKVLSIYELLEKINYCPKNKPATVTFHYPCHIRGTNEEQTIKNMLNKLSNTRFVESKLQNSCCGAAGSFIFTNNKISKIISKNKAEDIIATGTQIVLTSCPSCYLGLKQGLIEKNSDIEVMQLTEFLAE